MLLVLHKGYVTVIMIVNDFVGKACTALAILGSFFVRNLNELHLMVRHFLHGRKTIRKTITMVTIPHVFVKHQKFCSVVLKWDVLLQGALQPFISCCQLMLQLHVSITIQSHPILFIHWDHALKALNPFCHNCGSVCDLLIVNSHIIYLSILLIDDMSEVLNLLQVFLLCECLIPNHVVHILANWRSKCLSCCRNHCRTHCKTHRTNEQHLRMVSYPLSESRHNVPVS